PATTVPMHHTAVPAEARNVSGSTTMVVPVHLTAVAVPANGK
ncbi:hypothetical protein A2U01_0036836, partial [Trifolium medium]|nr:hypothetical protein [Trifolium medium]